MLFLVLCLKTEIPKFL